jgi:hypothetical protein
MSFPSQLHTIHRKLTRLYYPLKPTTVTQLKASWNETTKGQKLCMGLQEVTVSYTQQLQKTVSSFTDKSVYTGRFIMFSVITNIYNKKTKGPTLMELFKATGKLNFFFFDN